jgi:hypothetical protein
MGSAAFGVQLTVVGFRGAVRITTSVIWGKEASGNAPPVGRPEIFRWGARSSDRRAPKVIPAAGQDGWLLLDRSTWEEGQHPPKAAIIMRGSRRPDFFTFLPLILGL